MKLKPCPFCGNDDELMITNDADAGIQRIGELEQLPADELFYYVMCVTCGGYGPKGLDEEPAAKEWNRRGEK